MPNAYTDTSGSSLGTNVVQTAYDRLVEFDLRSLPLFRQFVTKRPARQAMPGDSVVIQMYNDLAEATGELVETEDPDAVAIGNTTPVTITLRERGNAAIVTRKLNLFALADVDPAVASIIAYNQATSVDTLAQTALRAGTNVIRENGGSIVIGGAVASVTSTDYVKARDFRVARTKMVGQSVVPWEGDLFNTIIHPDVSLDLRTETGANAWRTPQEYGVSQDRIWTGTVGVFEGQVFHESPRCYNATDGASSARVYRSYVLGRQGLAEAVAEEPHVVIGPVTDKLMRFRPIGWYGVLGHAIFRQEAVYRIEAAASIPV